MLITPAELRTQYERAKREWPFIDDVARAHGVPHFLLYAVGSRETNLVNERGDGGHGRGVWQRDDRWHKIPRNYDSDVRRQAQDAAALLKANLMHFDGHAHPAVAAYNAGIANVEAGIREHGDPDYFTTHSAGIGYGAEVIARWHFLRTNYGGRMVRHG